MLERLKRIIQSYEKVLVAFSGGIDSALVLKVSRDVLGRSNVKAVTAQSESVAVRELEAAKKCAEDFDVEHWVIQTHEINQKDYHSNPPNRCYFCKSELYDQLLRVAKQWDFKAIANGVNLDDLKDHRPGIDAGWERGIKSPLVEAALTKQDIRTLSRELGISIWDKPAEPCLASRFPYGSEITPEKLNQVERGENFLKDLGFKIVRLRHFDHKARLELGHEEFLRLTDVSLRSQVSEFICSLGFKTVIFEPYQSGRLNEVLQGPKS